MPSPAAILSAALHGRECHVTRREFDWSFDFGERRSIAAPAPWRVVTADGIAHGADDDGHWFGLAEPVDGEARTNDLLRKQRIVGVEVDEQTADLRLVFDGGARLDVFNKSSGYEGWQAFVPADGTELTITALGGGGLATY